MDDAIRFAVEIFKFQTLIDGGWRLTLDGSGQPDAVTRLLEAKQPGVILECAAIAVKPENDREKPRY
jgi:hypothetical protein